MIEDDLDVASNFINIVKHDEGEAKIGSKRDVNKLSKSVARIVSESAKDLTAVYMKKVADTGVA